MEHERHRPPKDVSQKESSLLHECDAKMRLGHLVYTSVFRAQHQRHSGDLTHPLTPGQAFSRANRIARDRACVGVRPSSKKQQVQAPPS